MSLIKIHFFSYVNKNNTDIMYLSVVIVLIVPLRGQAITKINDGLSNPLLIHSEKNTFKTISVFIQENDIENVCKRQPFFLGVNAPTNNSQRTQQHFEENDVHYILRSLS